MGRSRAAHLFTAHSGNTAYNSFMKSLRTTAFAVTILALPLAALADGHKHKQEYWDGNCKVEIKQKHGEYQEKRKCKGPQPAYVPAPVYVVPQQQPVVVAPRPVYVPAPQPVYVPAPRAAEPGLTIQATIPIR